MDINDEGGGGWVSVLRLEGDVLLTGLYEEKY